MEMKSGRIWVADFAGESLAFGDVFLAEAFGAMAENFVEENGGGTSGQQRGAGKGIDERSLDRAPQFPRSALDSFGDEFIAGSVLGVEPVEIVVAIDVHAVGRFALHIELEAVMNLAERQFGPFASHLVLVGGERRERGNGIQDGRRLAERSGVFADALFPGLAVHVDGRRADRWRCAAVRAKNRGRCLLRSAPALAGWS